MIDVHFKIQISSVNKLMNLIGCTVTSVHTICELVRGPWIPGYVHMKMLSNSIPTLPQQHFI